MARIGRSPTRNKSSKYKPAKVSVTVISFIPELVGYHKHRLDILKLTLQSLIINTEKPFDLMVFDNGSCEDVTNYLTELKNADYLDFLFLSKQNIGKIGAMQILFNAAPGEIIAYSDDDVFFYPGWLSAHLEILTAFPEVGMVSGVGVRNRAERSSESMKKYLSLKPDDLEWSNERRIPDNWEADWALSTGREPEEYLTKTANKKDLIVKLRGIEAFAGANHFQFLSPKNVLIKALPDKWVGKLMGEMMELDEAVDQQNKLRLSTVDRYTRHIGNTISGDLLSKAETLSINYSVDVSNSKYKKHWLMKIPGVGRILLKIYDWLFNVLNGV
jgi:glycosyltransferase involved in cell wall biosynthesis